MHYTTPATDNIPLDQIINHPDALTHVPRAQRTNWPRPIVGHWYPRATGAFICNYTKVAQATSANDIAAAMALEAAGAPCGCHLPQLDPFRDPTSGHVTTTDH